jgi:hypothetical protein
MENSAKFNKTQGLIDFLISQGANTCKIVRNPHTGKRFFAVEGLDTTGRVATAVETLSADLQVSWFAPADGEASWMIHKAGEDTNTLATFSVQ